MENKALTLLVPILVPLLLPLLLACALAILLVLALRTPLRRLCGAPAAYQAWLLVPLAMLMSLMPSWTPARLSALESLPVLRIVKGAGSAAQAASAQGGWGPWLALVWVLGTVAVCLFLVRAQRKLERQLGSLQRRGDWFVAQDTLHGPLLLGVLRPRIVVPADFEQRYSPEQQTMVIAHEHMHRRRRDPAINLLLAVLQCIFWFHPLVHLAVARCRFDQELACDTQVMAHFPEQRSAYARALLQTQFAAAPPPASCHWQSSHPLKERIMNLQTLSHSASRRHAGRLILAACAVFTAYGALAAGATTTPAKGGAPIYQLSVTMDADGASSTQRMRSAAPGKFELRSDPAGKAWSAAFVVSPAGAGKVAIATTITRQGKIVGKPGLLVALGQSATVKAGGDNPAENYTFELEVTEVDSLQPDA